MITLLYKGGGKIVSQISRTLAKLRTRIKFIGNGVVYETFSTSGTPYVMVARGQKQRFIIGRNFSMHNKIQGNPIGCYQRCTFFVDRNAKLKIGDNVGISQTALIAHGDITIGNNVKIGGGCCVYTTDFHALDPAVRSSVNDTRYKVIRPVVIEDNVFIGAHSLILKGVTIGKNSVVGAGSVVTKSIPPNQIWAGNPARFIREL